MGRANEPIPPPPDLGDIIFRDRLRRLIERDGRPVKSIAEQAGLNHQLVYQILSGYRNNPSIKTVGRLLVAMGARWADLD